MPLDQGFNFRDTVGFVANPSPANCHFAPTGGGVGVSIYPATIGSATAGWVGSETGNSRDRSAATGDARTAGIVYTPNANAPKTFRVDLPNTGIYEIRVAFGDNGGSQTIYFRLLDNATAFGTVANVNPNSDQYVDATGTIKTSTANWVSGNTAVTRTFASTIFILEVGDVNQVGGGNTSLAHLRVTEVVVAAAPNWQRSIITPTGTSGAILRGSY